MLTKILIKLVDTRAPVLKLFCIYQTLSVYNKLYYLRGPEVVYHSKTWLRTFLAVGTTKLPNFMRFGAAVR